MKQSATKPVIAITTATQNQCDSYGHHRAISRINNRYVALATDFGAVPILLFAETDPSAAKELLKRADGLIIIGGQDLDPKSYGKECEVKYEPSVLGAGEPFRRPLDLKPNRMRDDFEIALYAAAIDLRMPVLGICRGMQLINVAEGGTLHQEIPHSSVDHSAGADGFVHHHPIEIARDTFTYQTLERDHYFTSSIHHQAIDKLGANLTKAAWAADGIIEIVERVDADHMVLGVHGHIEQTRKNLPLYEKFLSAYIHRCREFAEGFHGRA